MKKANLCILFGAASSEYEISLLSASSVLAGLDKDKYNITKIGITREGDWYYLPEVSPEEIKSGEFTIVDFDGETQSYNCGNGVICDDWWKGFVLHDLGYVSFPFTYTEDMEDYVRFESLWTDANCNGWRECTVSNNTYLVCRF